VEAVISRYRNMTILAVVLFVQVLGLAVQVRKNTGDGSSTRLVRLWVISVITPMEKGVVNSQHWVSGLWHSYVDLRRVRVENQELKDELERIRLDQVRMVEDAAQARRLQALLAFKEEFVSQTIAAQVIGSSGSEQSRLVFIDKGFNDGIKPDMAVVTPDGVVGKVVRVAPGSAQVLLISDQLSGVGAILESSRLQSVLKGTPAGETILSNVMADEMVVPGERVLTSGGDRIFPKGLPIGVVSQVSKGPDLFLNVRVTPAAHINRLEEVLVITKIVDKTPDATQAGPVRAADILAQRLPTVQVKPPVAGNKGKYAEPPPMSELLRQQKAAAANGGQPAGTAAQQPNTSTSATTGTTGTKPATAAAKKPVVKKPVVPPTEAGTTSAPASSGTTAPASSGTATTTDSGATQQPVSEQPTQAPATESAPPAPSKVIPPPDASAVSAPSTGTDSGTPPPKTTTPKKPDAQSPSPQTPQSTSPQGRKGAR
jgi:rod shape-determining protein MreC